MRLVPAVRGAPAAVVSLRIVELQSQARVPVLSRGPASVSPIAEFKTDRAGGICVPTGHALSPRRCGHRHQQYDSRDRNGGMGGMGA